MLLLQKREVTQEITTGVIPLKDVHTKLTFILVENPVWDLQSVFHFVLVTLCTPTGENKVRKEIPNIF